MNLDNWLVRAGIVAGLTYLAMRYIPAGALRTGVLAVGAVSVAGIVGSNVPLAGALISGRLPVPAPAAPAA